MNVSQCPYAVVLLLSLSCSGPKKTTPPTRPDSVKTSVETVRPATPDLVSSQRQSAMKTAATPPAGTWVYKETVGEGGLKTNTASVSSPDILTFEKPFDGGARAILTLRKRNGSTTLSLSVSTGQFTSSFQGGQVRIRFDGSPSALYPFSAAANGNTDVIFLEPVQPLLQKLKSAKKTIINAGFYGQGTRKIEFKTAGLQWNG